MKRILMFLICSALLLSFVSCDSKDTTNNIANVNISEQSKTYDVDGIVLKEILKKYPDATVTLDGDKYNVVSENIDIMGITEISGVGVADAPVYNSLEEFYETLSPQRNIIFVGKKTGESKQYLPISAENGTISGLYYTNSKVEVTKAFYGDVKAGDIITYKEFYAVLNDENGNQRLLYTVPTPPKTTECLFVLSTNGLESLYGDMQYHDSIVSMGCLDISEMNKIHTNENGFDNNSISKEIYTKYVINNDVALDRYELTRSAVKYKNTMAQNSLDVDQKQNLIKVYNELLENKDTTLKEFNSVLDKKEIDLIEKLLMQYGEKNSSLAVK